MLLDMVRWIAVCGMLALGQTPASEKERALAEAIRREWKAAPFTDAAVAAYVARLGAEAVEMEGAAAMGLPGGEVLVPLGAIVASENAMALVRKIGHAKGHVVLRHGYLRGNFVYVALHGDGALLPRALAAQMPRMEAEAESYAARFAARQPLDEAEFERVKQIVSTAIPRQVRKPPSLRRR